MEGWDGGQRSIEEEGVSDDYKNEADDDDNKGGGSLADVSND